MTISGDGQRRNSKVCESLSFVWLFVTMDCRQPGSSVCGILQARILEWVIIPFSRESFRLRSWTQISHIASIFFTIWANKEARWHKYSPFSPWGGKAVSQGVQFSSVTQSCLNLQPHGLQHTRLPCPSPTPGACSNSSPLSWWCHATISSSVTHFSSCLQSFPALGSFAMSHFFTNNLFNDGLLIVS